MKLLIVFYLFAFYFLSSCKRDILGKAIDSDILISTNYKNGKIYIDAETENIFECINYSIDYSVLIDEKTITIDFIDVSIQRIRFIAQGPAISEIDLDELEQGDYMIIFNLNGVKTKAQLNVDCSGLSMKFIKAGNVKLKDSTLLMATRIPSSIDTGMDNITLNTKIGFRSFLEK